MIEPLYDTDGVPNCAFNACSEYDGKRCGLLGRSPDRVCTPAVVDMGKSIVRFRARQAELLQVIATISQSTPLDSEVSEALEQRGKLLAEVGTLRSQLAESRRELAEYKDAVQAETMARLEAMFGNR